MRSPDHRPEGTVCLPAKGERNGPKGATRPLCRQNMCTPAHTRALTCTHAHPWAHTATHTHTHACPGSHALSRALIPVHLCAHLLTCSLTHLFTVYSHTHLLTHALIRGLACAHSPMLTSVHTHTHSHTETVHELRAGSLQLHLEVCGRQTGSRVGFAGW